MFRDSVAEYVLACGAGSMKNVRVGWYTQGFSSQGPRVLAGGVALS